MECGTGGRTKYNRTKLGLPKEHYYDACCVGASTPDALIFKTQTVLDITAKSRGQYRRTKVNSSGFPRAYMPRKKDFFGFQSGDMVKAIVPSGKKKGIYYGTVGCRNSGYFNIKTVKSCVQGINHKYFKLIQRNDGYGYSTERRKAIPPTT